MSDLELGEFHKLDVADRINGLAGQPAEDAFLRWQSSRGNILDDKVFRYGFDRVPTTATGFTRVSPVLRHTPDYVAEGHLWECEGSTGTWQIKQEKVDALNVWHQLTVNVDLRWFLYNSADETAVVCSHVCLLAVIAETNKVADLFPGENKPGWLVTSDSFANRFVAGSPFEAERAQYRLQAHV